jgi:hypothetical protein
MTSFATTGAAFGLRALAGKLTLNRLERSRPFATRYRKTSHD